MVFCELMTGAGSQSSPRKHRRRNVQCEVEETTAEPEFHKAVRE